MIIQVLLTLGLVVLVAYAYAQREKSRVIRSGMTAVGLVGLYFVWLPEVANDLAHLVGVGRGADLVLYCWIIISLIVALNLHIVTRANLRLITELARHIALSEPRLPRETSPRHPDAANDKDAARAKHRTRRRRA
jgi:small membrane protein